MWQMDHGDTVDHGVLDHLGTGFIINWTIENWIIVNRTMGILDHRGTGSFGELVHGDIAV